MYKFAKATQENRQAAFEFAAAKKGLSEAIIEKDFWVCLMLDYLFHKCRYGKHLTFKGGTSLSKCFGIIERFSEDIDLILDWRLLGYTKDEPWEERSKTKQLKFNAEANEKAAVFLRDDLLPLFKNDFREILGGEADFFIDAIDPQTICFRYPRAYESDAILQVIRLEIGALAAWTPWKEVTVSPYLVDCFPNVFTTKSSVVRTAAAERTFWEKVTILHQEANRPEASLMPGRYSRHYYDLYCFAQTEYKAKALEHRSLLKAVTEFKMKFYPRNWAKYEDALDGRVRLVPPEFRLPEIKKDYDRMMEMFFQNSDRPDFNSLMEVISELEKELTTVFKR